MRSRFKDNDPLVQKLQRNARPWWATSTNLALLKLDLALPTCRRSIAPWMRQPPPRTHPQAPRDEATLVTLQNQLKQFERASPCCQSLGADLNPTLLDKPVSLQGPHLALGSLAGLVLGSGSA